MKKVLLTTIFSIYLVFSILAQPCIPDQSLTQPGFSPDSATNLPPGMLGVFYETVISAKIPAQESIGTITGDVDSIRITNVTGLPQGFIWETNSSTNTWPKNALGCMKISGMPAAEGVFPIKVILKIWGKVFSMPAEFNDTIEFYKIVIGLSSVKETISNKLALINVFPNPTKDFVNFEIISPTIKPVNIRVVNLLGGMVHENNFNLKAGLNTLQMNLTDLIPGIYFYQISDGTNIVTRKLIIER